MKRRLLPHLTLLAFLGGLAVISARTVDRLSQPGDPLAVKYADAERTIVYRVTEAGGLRFRLDGTGEVLKLVSYAVMPGAYDPARTVEYGFALTIRDGEQVIWEDQVHVSARQSKAGWDGARWRDEATFAVDPIELGDERVVLLSLPPVPAGATLSMSLLGAAPEALVRVFEEHRRGPAQRRRTADTLDDTARAELVRSSSYLPWTLLSDDERDRRLEHRWLRISALGERGTDYTTRTILVSGFRTPAPATAPTEGIMVHRDLAAAINVHGPARLELAVAAPHPGAALDVTVTGAAVAPATLALDAAPAILVLTIPAGPATVEVHTDEPLPIWFTMSGPPDSLLASAALREAVAPGQLTPERVRVPLAIAGAAPPVEARVFDVPGAPLLGRALRIDARVLDPVGPDGAPMLAELRLAYRDRDGQVIADERQVIGGPASRFEELDWAGALRRVAEPTSLRVLAPAGATTLAITADRDVAVRLYRLGAGKTVLEEPYQAAVVADHRWRYPRLITRPWYPMLPANHTPLGDAGRTAELIAQIRLEPIGDGEPAIATGAGATGALASIEPVGNPEQQRVHEPVPPEDVARVLAGWPAGALTRLDAGVARRLDFGRASSRRPRLQWAVDAAGLGGELTVEVDGAVALRSTLRTSRGSITLPRIAPGVHQVRVIAPAGADLLVDRPPVGDPRGLIRERTVYALTTGNIMVRLRKRAGRSVRLHAIVYAAGRAGTPGPALRILLDGGQPRRRTGVAVDLLSIADRRAALPAARRDAAARLVDLGGRSAGLPRTVSIGLLDDLATGAHLVELYGLTSRELWVRFVAIEDEPAVTGPRQWSLGRQEDVDAQ